MVPSILLKESVVVWSWREESNLQPAVYKTAALPLSYASPAKYSHISSRRASDSGVQVLFERRDRDTSDGARRAERCSIRPNSAGNFWKNPTDQAQAKN